jgi:hypothetical protein
MFCSLQSQYLFSSELESNNAHETMHGSRFDLTNEN